MRGRGFKINWGEAIVPAIALAFLCAFFLQCTGAPMDALVWPMITGACVLVGLFFVVKASVLTNDSATSGAPGAAKKEPAPAGRPARRIDLILSASIAYLLVIPYLGFTLTNFLFMLVVFRCLGSRRWGQNLVVAAGIALFLHVALVVLMKQELPRLSIGSLMI